MSEQKEWTIMVYMAGNNNLSVEMAHALNNIRNAAKDCNSKMNLLVYYDGYTQAIPTLYCDFANFEKPIYQPSYQVEKKLYKVEDKHNEDSASSLSVLNFVDWCINKRKRRADNYGLIFAGHTFGFQSIGILKDQFTGNSMSMEEIEWMLKRITQTKEEIVEERAKSKIVEKIKHTKDHIEKLKEDLEDAGNENDRETIDSIAQLQKNLEQKVKKSDEDQKPIIGQKLGILGFDSCVMAMLEVGYQFRDYSETMIASEGSIPSAGWAYTEILGKLAHTSDVTEPKKVAAEFVEEFIKTEDSYTISGSSVDMAAWDLSELENLKHPLVNLNRIFLDAFSSSGTLLYRQLKKAFLQIHRDSQSYMLKQNIDLGDFCELLKAEVEAINKEFDGSLTTVNQANVTDLIETNKRISAACDEVLTQLKKCVLLSGFSGGNYQFSNGISLFFPWSDSAFDVSRKDYEQLEFIKHTRAGKLWNKILNLYLGEVTYRKGINKQNSEKILLHSPCLWESENQDEDSGMNQLTRLKNDPNTRLKNDPNTRLKNDPNTRLKNDPNTRMNSDGSDYYFSLFEHFENTEIPWNVAGFTKTVDDSSKDSDNC